MPASMRTGAPEVEAHVEEEVDISDDLAKLYPAYKIELDKLGITQEVQAHVEDEADSREIDDFLQRTESFAATAPEQQDADHPLLAQLRDVERYDMAGVDAAEQLAALQSTDPLPERRGSLDYLAGDMIPLAQKRHAAALKSVPYFSVAESLRKGASSPTYNPLTTEVAGILAMPPELVAARMGRLIEVFRGAIETPAAPTGFTASPGYESLFDVLQRAHDQAAKGKGKDRHVQKDEPFDEQIMQIGAKKFGVGSLLFQAFKKSEEAQRLPTDRAVAELLGAINYLAGAVIRIEADAKASVTQSEA